MVWQKIFAAAFAALTFSGCASPYYRDQLAVFGGLTGATVGAALSNGNKNVGENAAIGAAVGALTGAAVGDHIDSVEARNQAIIQANLGRQLAGAVTFADVVAMSHAGLGDGVITMHIASHGVARPPTAQDLIMLKQQGVSDGVLQALQAPAPPAVVAAPPFIVEEPILRPPPRLGFHYQHHSRHHHRPWRRRPHAGWGFSISN